MCLKALLRLMSQQKMVHGSQERKMVSVVSANCVFQSRASRCSHKRQWSTRLHCLLEARNRVLPGLTIQACTPQHNATIAVTSVALDAGATAAYKLDMG